VILDLFDISSCLGPHEAFWNGVATAVFVVIAFIVAVELVRNSA
jgi:hypothetical protein